MKKNPYSVVIVDDNESVLRSLKRSMRNMPVEVYPFRTPIKALSHMAIEQVDILITDQRMPGMDGMRLLEEVKEESPDTIRILVTGYAELDLVIQAINKGNVFKFLEKPIDHTLLSEVMNEAFQLVDLKKAKVVDSDQLAHDNRMTKDLLRQINQMKVSHEVEVVRMLSRVIESKDPELLEHSKRVAERAVGFAEYLKLSAERVTALKKACLFHDIGKIAIRDRVLYKEGKLSTTEFEEMKYHTIVGATMLREMADLELTAQIVDQHHERYDGNGYPAGLKGDEILLEARILTINDVFDALTSKRIYREALSIDEGLQFLKEHIGTHFDPELVKEFESWLDQARGERYA